MNNHYSNNYKKINQSKNSTKPHNLTKDFKNKPKPNQNPSTSNESTPRINKAIATSGFCSRRKADELIFAGKVMVNGKIEQNPGTRLKKGDVISIDGQTLAWDQTPKFYLLLNKPIHTVCTAHDPEGRTTVLDLLPDNYHNIRLFPVGRLDYFSEGLLILTNDGDLTNMLIH
ncbi:MAG: rRNA pseudouridine synthase, partial [Desulfovibrionaceae bacterium]|nr:rRNA pseudouridine synthase [Desulfovibrionaceae bacterium]